MIPGLNDHELEAILEAAADAGAGSAGYVLLRLPLELADLFTEWLETHYPLKRDRVLALIRETRDGAMYQSEWGTRMSGVGPYAEMLGKRFAAAVRRLRLDGRDLRLDTSRFRVPAAPGDQPSLFDEP
jgi:DNA repair photolyase